MASFDGAIRISTKMDTSGFDRGIRTMEGGFGKLGQTLDRCIKGLTAKKVVETVVQAGKAVIETAAEVQAANSQFEQAFGALGDQAEEMVSRVASASGIVETRLRGAATSIFAFARTTGMESAQALDLTERALTAAADSAAYYDRSLEDTSETLKSFLKGNYENDAALGLSCTETTRNAAANKLYGKSFAELAEDQKQLTLLQMVEDANALSGAMGQAAREADGWENVTGNLKEAWRQLMAVAGEPLLAGAVPVVKSLTDAVGALTGFVRDQVDAFHNWTSSLDLGPIQSSFHRFKTNVVTGLKLLWANTEPLRDILKGLFQFLIETGFPAVLDAMSMVSGAVNAVWSVIRPVVEGIANALDAIVGTIKSGVAWLFRLFGMEPPKWTQEDDDEPGNTFEVDTEDAVENLGDLTDAAQDAEEAIEDADSAAGAGGGGSGGSGKRDVLGFDQITKLSEQSGGSGGGSGGSGSGGSDTGTGGASSAAPVTQAAKANEELQQGAEQTQDAVDDLSLSIELLTGNLRDAVGEVNDLLRPRTATTTLILEKGEGYDELLDQWNSLTGDTILKKLLHQLTLEIRAKVAVAVQAQADQAAQNHAKTGKDDYGKTFGSHAIKNGTKQTNAADPSLSLWDQFKERIKQEFSERLPGLQMIGSGWKDTWASLGQFMEGFTNLNLLEGIRQMHGSLNTWVTGVAKMGEGVVTTLLGTGRGTRKQSTGILDTVKKWWNSLTRGKATKTLDLKGGSFRGGSGGFAQGVKQWESLANATITKTLKGNITSTYTHTKKDWETWSDGSITKTAKGARDSTYTSVKGDWNAWTNGTVTKTTKGARDASYTNVKGDWNGWKNASVTKTAKGAKDTTYTSAKSDWNSWQSTTVTKTMKAATSSNWNTIKSDWNSLKDKTVSGNIALKATISNIRTWMNSNVVSPLNKSLGKVFKGVSVPKLARGGVVNRATLAQIGEAGREVVLPLERNTGWMDLLAQKLGEHTGGGGTVVVPVYIGDEKVAEHVVSSINAATRTTGTCPLVL